jgi:raffinose synthase
MAACWRLRVALLLNIMSLSLRAAIVVPAPGAGWQLPMQVGSNLVSKDKVLLEGLPASISTDSTRDPRGAFLSYTVQRAASEHVVSVGRLGCKRFLACSRQKLWWMNPEWGTKGSEIPDETQFLLFQLEDRATAQGIAEGDADPQVRAHQGRENESYGVIFPLISGAFRSSLEASKLKGPSLEHCISLRIESGDSGIMADSIEHVAFVATGSDPFALVRESMQAVQRKLQTFRLRTEKPQPPVMDKFGWCTWDAFYSKVDGPGIEYGVKTLRDGGTPPRMLIIDDGWQDTSDAQPGGASPGLQAGPLTRLTSFASSLVSLLRHKLLLLLTGYHDR